MVNWFKARMLFHFFILCAALISSAYSFDDATVKVVDVSKSGKTFYLNKGSNSIIKDDDFGVLVKKVKIAPEKFVYRPVAKIKAVRVFGTDSIWISYKEFIKGEIKKGNKLLLFSETKLLQGKTKLRFSRTNLVVNKNQENEVADFLLEGDSLAKKKDDYKVLDVGHKKDKDYKTDINLVDLSKYDNRVSDGRLYIEGIYQSPHSEDFAQRIRVQSFEKMVVAILNKYNDPTYNYETFYKEQERGETGIVPEKQIYSDLRETIDYDYNQKVKQQEQFYRSFKKKGELWSEDFSDQELSEMLTNLSVAQEAERRQSLSLYKYNYQYYLSLGMNLINNENLKDYETTEQSKYDTEFSIEGYFFKTFESLKRYTFEVSARRAKDAYYGGTLNVKSTEYSMAGHFNWYPFALPSSLEKNIVYLGMHFRYGLARLSNIGTGEEGNYQVSSVPGFRAGLKYNFKNSFGFRMFMNYERIKSNRIENSGLGNMPDRAFYTEGKLAFSLSKLF